MQFEPYFKLAARKGVRGVVADQGTIIFKDITEKRARTLWEEGFANLHITPDGARHFYKDATTEQRIALLESCKTPLEVEALLKLPKNHPSVKKAANERLAELGVPPTSSGEAGGPQPKG
jgi:hypothetical protein